MNKEALIGKASYLGLSLITMATLLYEILLTRIFSVTMYYHFAFIAVSVALFGMTVGAIIVYLLPGYFKEEKAKYHISLAAFWFAIFTVVSCLYHLSTPFLIGSSIINIFSMFFLYVMLSIPFIFSGIAVCLALTKFPKNISRLYAADLIGGAAGCLLLTPVLGYTDGPTAVAAVAFLATLGALLFAYEQKHRKMVIVSTSFFVLFAGFVAVNTVMVHRQASLLKLRWVKGKIEQPSLYEKWNSFSRIKVWGPLNKLRAPFGWGFSQTLPKDYRAKYLGLDIDSDAYTPVTGFNGDPKSLAYLKYDVVNLVHYLRNDAKVLIVGIGGGRDLLSALAFDQKKILGVEINENIIKLINKNFGDYTGHLDKNPKITFVKDEARSYIARSKEKFDIIQVSLIDTFAATTAGAFVLTENSLYTTEAWKIFLDHLSSQGLLSFSRWYCETGPGPGEVYRVASLASASLLNMGIKNPRDHLFIAASEINEKGVGVATVIVSRSPLSAGDLETMEVVIKQMRFHVILSPSYALDKNLVEIASEKQAAFTKTFPINISAPTDDSPFFFNMLRLRDVFSFNRRVSNLQQKNNFNLAAVFTLIILLGIVVTLTLLCIILPLALVGKKTPLRGTAPYFIYFAGIGLGFMFVEISQMQRLTVFLGHPVYGLTVVLFTLLLASGLGSYFTQKESFADHQHGARSRWFILLGFIMVFGIITPYGVRFFQAATTMIRILVAVAMIFPLGIFMGMAFPIGMKLAARKSLAITPWLWGINGATSVCASVLSVVIALFISITASFWVGFFCYVAAFAAFLWARQTKARQG